MPLGMRVGEENKHLFYPPNIKGEAAGTHITTSDYRRYKMDKTKIDLENGKYTFIIREDGQVECLRFGEPWITFDVGSKAIIDLIYKAKEPKRDPNIGDNIIEEN